MRFTKALRTGTRSLWLPVFLRCIMGAILSRRLDEIRRYPFTLFGMAIVLTASTVISGQTVNGARLWLRIGPVQFQPSEVARLLIAGFVAIYLYDHRHLVVAPWRLGSVDLPPAPYLLPLAGAVLAAVAVLGVSERSRHGGTRCAWRLRLDCDCPELKAVAQRSRRTLDACRDCVVRRGA